MKKTAILFSMAILAVIVFANFVTRPAMAGQDGVVKPSTLPADVAKVVEKSCFGCHNTESRNDEAKEKLNFSSLENLNPMQKIGKVKAIYDEVEKGGMPPQRFLERFPDRKLSDAEAKILKDWAKKELGQ